MATTNPTPADLLAAADLLARAGYSVTPPKPVPYIEHASPEDVVHGGWPGSQENAVIDIEMCHVVTLAVAPTGEFGHTSDGTDYRYAVVLTEQVLDVPNGGHQARVDVLAKATTAEKLAPWLLSLADQLDNLDAQANMEAADDRLRAQAGM